MSHKVLGLGRKTYAMAAVRTGSVNHGMIGGVFRKYGGAGQCVCVKQNTTRADHLVGIHTCII